MRSCSRSRNQINQYALRKHQLELLQTECFFFHALFNEKCSVHAYERNALVEIKFCKL